MCHSGSLPAPRFICLENARIRPSFSLKQNNKKGSCIDACRTNSVLRRVRILQAELPDAAVEAPCAVSHWQPSGMHRSPRATLPDQNTRQRLDNTTHTQPQEEAAIAYKTNQLDSRKQLSSSAQSIYKMSSLTSFSGHQQL